MIDEVLVEGAALLRRILGAVDVGELEAQSPTGAAVRRRIEGAVIAAEIATGQAPGPEVEGTKN